MRIYGRQILQVGWTTLFTRRRSLPRIYSTSLWSFRSPLLGSGLRGGATWRSHRMFPLSPPLTPEDSCLMVAASTTDHEFISHPEYSFTEN